MRRNTQISMEQDRLNNSNEELSLSQDVITKRRSYQHQEALHKEELNSREEYLKAKVDYDLAVKKHALISKRLKKDAQLRRSQMDQMGDNLDALSQLHIEQTDFARNGAADVQHQEALHKEELNSREEYLKAKEDYDLAVKKHALIRSD